MVKIGDRVRLIAGKFGYDWITGKTGQVAAVNTNRVYVYLDSSNQMTMIEVPYFCVEIIKNNIPLPLPG